MGTIQVLTSAPLRHPCLWPALPIDVRRNIRLPPLRPPRIPAPRGHQTMNFAVILLDFWLETA